MQQTITSFNEADAILDLPVPKKSQGPFVLSKFVRLHNLKNVDLRTKPEDCAKAIIHFLKVLQRDRATVILKLRSIMKKYHTIVKYFTKVHTCFTPLLPLTNFQPPCPHKTGLFCAADSCCT